MHRTESDSVHVEQKLRLPASARADLEGLNPLQFPRDLDTALERLWALAAPDLLRLAHAR